MTEYIRNLCEEDPRRDVPLIGMQLYEHQKTLVHAMRDIETTRAREQVRASTSSNGLGGVRRVYSNFGVLTDPVGSGKTVVMLSVIADELRLNDASKHYHVKSGSWMLNQCSNMQKMLGYMSLSSVQEEMPPRRVLAINFVVVPHCVYTQWCACVRDVLPAGVRWRGIFGKSATDVPVDQQHAEFFAETYAVYVASANYWPAFFEKYLDDWDDSVLFSRIVVDEVDTIKFPNPRHTKRRMPLIAACFYWYISANTGNVLNPMGGFASHTGLQSLFLMPRTAELATLCFQNTPEWVAASVTMPPVTSVEYVLRMQDTLQQLVGMAGSFVVSQYLHAEDWVGLSQHLNVPIHNARTLYDYFSRDIDVQIANKENKLAYERGFVLPPGAPAHVAREHAERIRAIEAAIDSLRARREALRQNIATIDANRESCAICLDTISNPVFLKCCFHGMCAECFLQSLQTLETCPYCRHKITTEDIALMQSGIEDAATSIPQVSSRRSKLDVLLDIVGKRTPDQRFLVFSNRVTMCDTIEKTFAKNSVPHQRVSGSVYRMDRVITQYRSGECPVLVMSSEGYSTGLNLHETTDVVLFHRMEAYVETQMIGRAQRIGRTTPLRVHYIMYTTEQRKYGDANNTEPSPSPSSS